MGLVEWPGHMAFAGCGAGSEVRAAVRACSVGSGPWRWSGPGVSHGHSVRWRHSPPAWCAEGEAVTRSTKGRFRVTACKWLSTWPALPRILWQMWRPRTPRVCLRRPGSSRFHLLGSSCGSATTGSQSDLRARSVAVEEHQGIVPTAIAGGRHGARPPWPPVPLGTDCRWLRLHEPPQGKPWRSQVPGPQNCVEYHVVVIRSQRVLRRVVWSYGQLIQLDWRIHQHTAFQRDEFCGENSAYLPCRISDGSLSGSPTSAGSSHPPPRATS